MESPAYDGRGRLIFIETSGVPFFDGQGGLLGFRGISRDITERNKMKESLKAATLQAEHHRLILEMILQQMPAGVIITDASGAVAKNNEAMDRIWRRSMLPDENIDNHAYVGFHADGREYQFEEWPLTRSLRGGETIIGEEMTILRGDGTKGVIHISSAPIKDKNGNIVAGVVIDVDITERKRTEEALKSSERRFKDMFESSPIDMVLMNFDGTFIDINQAALDMHGFTSKDELIGTNCLSLVDPDYHQEIALRWAETLEKGFVRNVELVQLKKDGQKINTLVNATSLKDSAGKIYALLAMVQDITLRKRMEEELRESERQYRELVKYAPVGIYELDFRNMRLKSVNDAICLLTGYTKEEIMQMNPFDLLDEEGQRIFQERIRKWLAGEKSDEHVTYKMKAKDGHEIPADLLVTFTTDENGEPLGAIVIGQDITERKQIENEKILLESYQRNNEILESITDSFYALDQKLCFIYVNKGAEKAWGIPRSTLFGRKISEVFPDIINYSLAKFNRVLQEQTPEHYELYSQVTRKWVEMHVYPASNGISVYFRDFHERKLMEESLRESRTTLSAERELLKITLDSLGEAVLAVDREGRIIFINETVIGLTGYSRDEAVGQSLDKIIYCLNDKTSESVDITANVIPDNPILITRDLKEIPIAMNRSPIKAVDGGIIGSVIVFTDISEKQKMERELLKTAKLESLGILAGGIAHDFNNTLAAILANIQLAVRKSKKNEDISIYLENTIETAKKASDLTKQLLTFSKGGSPVKKDTSLIDLIKDTAEFALRGSNTKAIFEIPEDLWAASIDQGQISQVVHNLVINAQQAMPKGGFIHIKAENITIKEDSTEHATRACAGFDLDEYVKITVKDQGTGIPKENLANIFDPFFTTKKDGNGLGLATCYSIIKQHNGYIEIESEENAGTAFFIYLPASSGTLFEVDSPSEKIFTQLGLKILLMDDEKKIRQAVGGMLESHGYQVVLVEDGAETIEKYKQAKYSGEPFDVVIMDLTIPGGMGGQEAIAHLRDIDPHIKAIVSSGYANDPIMADYERFGFSGVVSKPYKFDELNEVINRMVERK